MKKPLILIMFMTALAVWGLGCQTQHQVETVHEIEVAPMHITIDVNVKVEKALDDFFGDLDQAEKDLTQNKK